MTVTRRSILAGGVLGILAAYQRPVDPQSSEGATLEGGNIEQFAVGLDDLIAPDAEISLLADGSA